MICTICHSSPTVEAGANYRTTPFTGFNRRAKPATAPRLSMRPIDECVNAVDPMVCEKRV